MSTHQRKGHMRHNAHGGVSFVHEATVHRQMRLFHDMHHDDEATHEAATEEETKPPAASEPETAEPEPAGPDLSNYEEESKARREAEKPDAQAARTYMLHKLIAEANEAGGDVDFHKKIKELNGAAQTVKNNLDADLIDKEQAKILMTRIANLAERAKDDQGKQRSKYEPELIPPKPKAEEPKVAEQHETPAATPKMVRVPLSRTEPKVGMVLSLPASMGGGTETVTKVDGDHVHFDSGFVSAKYAHDILVEVPEHDVKAAPVEDKPAPRPERPKVEIPEPGEPKTDEQLKAAQPWQLTEEEFTRKRYVMELARAERNEKGWGDQLDRLKREGAKAKAVNEAEMQRNANAGYAKTIKEKGVAFFSGERNRAEYVKQVKAAISKGEPVHPKVVSQYPEFTKAKDARARYDKGRHTSFANDSVAVDRSLVGSHGAKVKRQDGKPITEKQKTQIATGLTEIQEAIGMDLRPLMQHADITIAHTSGTMPFLRNDAAGLFHVGEETITMGVQVGPHEIKALAHELGHWLDFYAGGHAGHETRKIQSSIKGTSSHRVTTSSMAEHDASRDGSHLPAKTLFHDAERTMTDPGRVDRILRGSKYEKPTDEEKEQRKVAMAALGPYWREPAELFARMFEQYVATKLDKKGLASADDPQGYQAAPGWWSKEQFAKLMPAVEAEVHRRIAIATQGMARVKDAEHAADKAVDKAIVSEILNRVRGFIGDGDMEKAQAPADAPQELPGTAMLARVMRHIDGKLTPATQEVVGTPARTPGLFVHPATHGEGVTLSHQGSGVALADLDDEGEAMEAADNLAQYEGVALDWTLPIEEVKASPAHMSALTACC